MKLTVELQRVGMSRVSERNIPIMACVVQGNRRGVNLIPEGLTDLVGAKSRVESKLKAAFPCPLEIEWIDNTERQ